MKLEPYDSQRPAYEQILLATRRSQELWRQFTGIVQAMELLLRDIANRSEILSSNLELVLSRCGMQLAALQDAATNQASPQDGSSQSLLYPTTPLSTRRLHNGGKPRKTSRLRASTSKPSTRKAAKAVRTKGKLPRRFSSADVVNRALKRAGKS